MQFNSLLFLVFLAFAVYASWSVARFPRIRQALLLILSCMFYMSMGNPKFVLLILGSTCWDFAVANRIEATPDAKKFQRRLLLLASVGMNLSLLCYFKYLNFFAQSFNASMRWLGWDPGIPVLDIFLPIGISFYTFQTMSYCIDVYRREITAERSLLRFAVFSTFFPQMVAGPIVRARIFLPQLAVPSSINVDDVGEAMFRIGRGLAKKVAIADYLAVNLVDRVFSQPHIYSSAEVMVGLYAYTLQIYCDFSGYTDVAIGAARLFGYHLPENFNRPYQARSVAEFWRRWHITLSGWLRHYVFFPLGGSRGPLWLAQRNTLITLTLIGLWHGANWTFVIYGVLHACAIMLNRLLHRRKPEGWQPSHDAWPTMLWKVALTFHFVVLARILFRAPGMTAAWDVCRALATSDWHLGRIDRGTWAILLIGFTIHWTPSQLVDRLRLRFVALPGYAQGAALALLATAMAAVAETDAVPFIYFQF